MMNRTVFYTYVFILGVGASLYFHATPAVVIPSYIIAGICGMLGWSLAAYADKSSDLRIKPYMIYALLFVSAVSLGLGRHAQKAFIPPFDENAAANHMKAVIDKFPDITRNDRTRILGRIVAEPEFRPAKDRPGVIVLTVEPITVQPDTTSDKTYDVSEGNVMVYLRPSSFREGDDPFREVFEALATPDGYGFLVEIDAHFQGFKPADNPGLFDPELFYHDHEVFATASIPFWDEQYPPIAIREESKGSPIVELSLDIKKRMLGVMKQTVPFPESAFLAGVTLGSDRGLDGIRCLFEEPPPEPDEFNPQSGPPDLRQLILDEFRWSGTTHILSVSGLHVTIILGALWALFIIMRVPQKIYAIIIVFCLMIFCFITGAEPPTVRAVIMNTLVLLTYVYLGSSLRASLLMAIGVAAFVILLHNPKWLIEPSFALSFMAMLSLGLVTPPGEDLVKKIPGVTKLPAFLQTFLGAQVAIQLGMMWPLSAYYFCRMSLAGPVANLLAIPLSDIIIQLGLFASLLGLIPGFGLWLALTLNAANYILIWFFLWSTHITTQIFPYPFIQTMTPRMLLAYYFFLSLFIWNKPILRYARIKYYDWTMAIGDARDRQRSVIIFAMALVLCSATAVYGFWPRQPEGNLRVNFLAVRYGDAIHIETPGGAQILVDAGGNDFRGAWNTGERTISQYLLKDRIGRLDAVIMTSGAPENMGGIAAVLRIFPTARFYAPMDVWNWDPADEAGFREKLHEALDNELAESPRNTDFEDAVFLFQDLATTLRKSWGIVRVVETLLISPSSLASGFGRETQKIKVESGMVLWKENGPGGLFQIVALHPNPEEPLQSNNNSLVLRITYGATSYLLPSNLTDTGLAELMRLDKFFLKSDVLLLPSHGSPAATDPEFYSTVLPKDGRKRYAVLSFGWNKDLKPTGRGKMVYRDSFLSHRHFFVKDVEAGANALAANLEDSGVLVARTDEQGAIMTTSDGLNVSVTSMSGPVLSTEENLTEENERNLGI